MPPSPVVMPPSQVGGEILTCAGALRAACPEAEPVAFWDFDGTLFEGDCSEGFTRAGHGRIAGLVECAIAEGWSQAYPAAGGFARCWEAYQTTMRETGTAAAYLQLVRVFAGAPEGALRELAEREFASRLRPWFFAGALELWAELEAGGVSCMVISASADFFIKGAAGVLGVPADRLHGVRLAAGADGILTPDAVEPVTIGTGKAALLQDLLSAPVPRGKRYAVAAFGNDFFTDGPMLEAAASSILPVGAPVAALVNARAPASLAGRLRELVFPPRSQS
jgi:HAD superfamily phosphoserine phosphatase-like hydrolase